MAWAGPFNWIVPKEKLARGEGANLHVASSVLRTPPESSDPTVKNFSRLDFAMALLEAYGHGSEYPVLLDAEGYVTEGRGWNLFALFGGRLVSPDRGCLEGVTRATVLELCKKTNVKGELGRIRGDELGKADEIFLSSTAGGVMPATHLDGAPIGNGQPGPVTLRLSDLYWALHDDPTYATAVDYRDGA
jgi:branched-subunit amino acid aminotransferase/4-amino-4-deoxychorismate lyase